MQMLGPGITLASTPLAFGYSLFARTRARNRPLTYTALALSALEVAIVTAFVINAMVQFAQR